MKTKKCTKCENILSLDNFNKYRDSYQRYCKSCSRKSNKLWRDKHPQDHKKYRPMFFGMYGNICSCCGESHMEFLTIEHKLGQIGKQSKESSHRAYRKAVKEYRPDLYSVLCYNCNCSLGHWGYCPHQKVIPP